MKKRIRMIMITFIICCGNIYFSSIAQGQSLGASVAKKVGVYVFPAKGQDAAQQDKDQSACYTWAVQQSGVDPLNPPQVQAAQVPTGPDGAMIRGGARGAAGGAAIGAIAGDAGKGAAIGALVGGLRGRRASQVGHAMAQESNNQAASQQQANLMDNFKKAYSACLEGKGYTVQ